MQSPSPGLFSLYFLSSDQDQTIAHGAERAARIAGFIFDAQAAVCIFRDERGRPAAVQVESTDRAEAFENLREVDEIHAGRIAALPPVCNDDEKVAVFAESHRRTRIDVDADIVAPSV